MIHWQRPSLILGLACSLFSASATAQTTPDGKPSETTLPMPPAQPPAPSEWRTRFYGFVELDAIHDSTQSFFEASLNAQVAPRGTYLGDNGRTQFTAKNSRVGLMIEAPAFHGILATGNINFDFFGAQATELT